MKKEIKILIIALIAIITVGVVIVTLNNNKEVDDKEKNEDTINDYSKVDPSEFDTINFLDCENEESCEYDLFMKNDIVKVVYKSIFEDNMFNITLEINETIVYDNKLSQKSEGLVSLNVLNDTIVVTSLNKNSKIDGAKKVTVYDISGDILYEFNEFDYNKTKVSIVEVYTDPLNDKLILVASNMKTMGLYTDKKGKDYNICDPEDIDAANLSRDTIVAVQYEIEYSNDKKYGKPKMSKEYSVNNYVYCE